MRAGAGNEARRAAEMPAAPGQSKLLRSTLWNGSFAASEFRPGSGPGPTALRAAESEQTRAQWLAE